MIPPANRDTPTDQGIDDEPPISSAPPHSREQLMEHQFQTLPPAERETKLFELTVGVANHLAIVERERKNFQLDVCQRLGKVTDDVNYLLLCIATLMRKNGVEPPAMRDQATEDNGG